jgi:hypothetical protein
VTCTQAVAVATMHNIEVMAVSLSMHQLLHFVSAMRAMVATTVSTVLDDNA